MRYELDLSPQENAQVLERARQRGITPEDYVRSLVSRALAAEVSVSEHGTVVPNSAMLALMQESQNSSRRMTSGEDTEALLRAARSGAMYGDFDEDDLEDRRQSAEYLRRTLDEDRRQYGDRTEVRGASS